MLTRFDLKIIEDTDNTHSTGFLSIRIGSSEVGSPGNTDIKINIPGTNRWISVNLAEFKKVAEFL